jgi:hypothetical protein
VAHLPRFSDLRNPGEESSTLTFLVLLPRARCGYISLARERRPGQGRPPQIPAKLTMELAELEPATLLCASWRDLRSRRTNA